jgi:hypothetical protein
MQARQRQAVFCPLISPPVPLALRQRHSSLIQGLCSEPGDAASI